MELRETFWSKVLRSADGPFRRAVAFQSFRGISVVTYEFYGASSFSAWNGGAPGPNNTVAFSAGLNYGFLRTAPYILGVSAGVPLMTLAVALLGWGNF